MRSIACHFLGNVWPTKKRAHEWKSILARVLLYNFDVFFSGLVSALSLAQHFVESNASHRPTLRLHNHKFIFIYAGGCYIGFPSTLQFLILFVLLLVFVLLFRYKWNCCLYWKHSKSSKIYIYIWEDCYIFKWFWHARNIFLSQKQSERSERERDRENSDSVQE